MKVSIEKADNQKLVLTIETPADELGKSVDVACKQLANRVNIPGFRKGHAPKQIIVQRLGETAILDEAFEILAPKAFDDALVEQKIEPVDRPQIEIVTLEKGKNVVFKATVTPKPEVSLGEYKGLKAQMPAVEVNDEQIAEQIKNMRTHHAKMTDAAADAVVEKDNFITLDFLGKVDDKPFDGGEGKDYPLQIGSNSFIAGFEDQLIGMKLGEEKDVNVTFPQDYQEPSLAGKPAVFHCKINSIKIQELPELNDEFVKKSTSYDNVEDLKKNLREIMLKSAQTRAEGEYRTQVMKQVADNAAVDIPEVMVDNRVNSMLNELSANLQSHGMNMEQYLKYSNTDIAKLRETYREAAKEAVKSDLVLEKIAKLENIKVETREVDTEIAMMAARYGSTPKEVKKIITKNGYITSLFDTIGRKKAAQFVMDNLAK
ncbi:trigger factor [Pectinatus frisingensis]|jgi:trigger factor|uniref:trigger factor n=2 Tax=Pectinatus frisingensis TaxID=865 RepID=UPI0015F5EDC0|nr:trigger factor [Pectinatus frisingensis]